MDVSTQGLYCKNCGAPLEIPADGTSKVICPYCHSEMYVTRSDSKVSSDVDSGTMLTATAEQLHARLLDALLSSECMPLDVLENVVVTREEHLCVPAYLFSNCSGTAGFTYYEGVEQQTQVIRGYGSNMHAQDETYTNWTPCSNSVSCTYSFVMSATEAMTDVVAGLYNTGVVPELVSAGSLKYPDDVQKLIGNVPHASAFDKYGKSAIEKALMVQAQTLLEEKNYRDLRISGSNITTGEMIHITLGIYRITFEYKGQEYYVYISGDGAKFYYSEIPVDVIGVNHLKAKQSELDMIPQPKKWNFKGIPLSVIVLIVGMVLFCLGIGIGVVLIVIGIILIVVQGNGKKRYDNARIRVQGEINAFMAQRQQAVFQFKGTGRKLKGIYADN